MKRQVLREGVLRPVRSAHQDFATTLGEAKRGSEWAWSRLLRNLLGPVTGYFAAHGAHEPDDLASETMLQVARNIATFEGDESNFRSWVFVIAHRRLIDSRRVHGRRPTLVPIDDDFRHVGGNSEEEAIEIVTTDDIVKLMSTLTEDQRDVLLLRIVGNLTLRETAQAVGKRVGAVKMLQSRGLASLATRGVLPDDTV